MSLQHSSEILPQLDHTVFKYTKGEKEIHIFPVIHDEIAFSAICGRILDNVNPSLVAVELPHQLKFELLQSIKRFPTFTLVHRGEINDEKFVDNEP